MAETVQNLSIIVPTYNEKDNIPILLYMIQKHLNSLNLEYEVVVVDDNSPDGTFAVVQSLKKVLKMDINLLKREKKLGLGSSYIFALKHCKYDFVLIMDSDLSHHPKYLPNMIQLQRLTSCDLVTCTRYNNSYYDMFSLDNYPHLKSTNNRLKKPHPSSANQPNLSGLPTNSTLKRKIYGDLLKKVNEGPEILRSGASNWPIRRVFVSKMLNFLCRLLFNSKFTDLTGSYRLYKKKHLLSVLNSIHNKGFLFQMELALICDKKLKLRVNEVPIVFVERIYGHSKFGLKEISLGLKGLLKLMWEY